MPVYQLAASSAHLNWNGFQSFLCKAPTVSRFLKTCSSSVCLLPSKHIVVGCAPKWSKSSLAPCSNIFKRPLKPASACKRYKCCSWMFMAAFMTPYVLLHYEQVWTGPRFPSMVPLHCVQSHIVSQCQARALAKEHFPLEPVLEPVALLHFEALRQLFASICCILFAPRIMETLALGRCSLLQRLKTKGAHANSGLAAKSWTVTMTMLHDLILIHKEFTRCRCKVPSFR